MKNKYYVLENKNILAEEDYIKLRTSEYLQDNEGYETLNDYLEDATDFSLIDIIEINEDDFKNCNTLDELIGEAFSTGQIFEEEAESFIYDTSLFIENKSFCLYIDGYNYLNVEFEALENENEETGEQYPELVKIKYIGYDFV